MASDHHFNVEIAKEYGLDCATFLTNLAFLIRGNLANKRNVRYGFCWSYNTQDALQDYHPYWSIDQIKRITTKAEKEGLLVKAPLGRSKSDHTNWYSLTPKGFKYFPELIVDKYLQILIKSEQDANNLTDEKDKSLISLIRRNRLIDQAESPDRWSEIAASYITDIKPDKKTDTKKSSCESKPEKPKAESPKKPPMTPSSMRAENEKKPEWAGKPKSPMADVTKQSTSYDPVKHALPKTDPDSPGYQNFRNSVPCLRRKYQKTG